ncbi:MAG: hypothetical protein IJW18_00365 [Lachnospiraceae bacterium]|nr:hypothetical protein [Lachnospiraceae bacterium]
MKRNFVYSKILPVMLIGSLYIAGSTLSGCALLPAEDTGRAVPTVAARPADNYNMVVVTRTDIINSKNITCNYSEKGGVDLSFETGGKHFGKVYVAKGETVTEGQLLATLNMGSLETDIENLAISIAEHEAELAQSLELRDLEIDKINTQYKYGLISQTKRDTEIQKITDSYASSNAYLEETLYLEKLEYDTLLIKQQKSSIYSPIDGIVTYLSSEIRNSDKTSVQGKTMITVSDASDCVFQATTEYASYFSTGDTVTITMTRGGTGTYDAVVEIDATNPRLMYIYPTEEIADLSIDAKATFSLIIDSRDNVLAVSSGAIKSTKDFSYVYYVNEDGVRDIKFVETGINGNGMTEIISGLEYGEAVIKTN